MRKKLSIIKIISNKIFFIFETIEKYINISHDYIKNKIGIEYPYDLLTFSLIGFIFYQLINYIIPEVINNN